ncbi:hypothetical protein GCM10027038_23850 [Arthrobacter bambusae]
MRPAPENLTVAEVGEVFRLRFGQEDDIRIRDQFFAACHATDQRLKLAVRKAEALAVAALQPDVLPEFRSNALQMQRMDG